MCYLTLYFVTATSEWTTPLEAMYILFALCIPNQVGTNPFQPKTHLHSPPLIVKDQLT